MIALRVFEEGVDRDECGGNDVCAGGGEVWCAQSVVQCLFGELLLESAEGLAFEERLRLGHVDAGFCSQYGSTHSKGAAGRDKRQVPWAKVKVTGLELLGDMGADGCFGFGRQRRVFIGDEALGQPHGTELEGEGLLDDAPLETDQFEAATPDVRLDEARLPRNGGIASQALPDVPGFFGATEDTDAQAGGFEDGLHEIVAIERITHRAGRNDGDVRGLVGERQAVQLADCGGAPGDGDFAQAGELAADPGADARLDGFAEKRLQTLGCAPQTCHQ